MGRLLLTLVAALLTTSCAENNGDPFNQNIITRLPVVVSDPVSGATSVDLRKVVTVSFPSQVDPLTLREENLILQKSGRARAESALVDRSFVFNATRREVTIFPRNSLEPLTSYELIVQGVRTPGGIVYETTTIRFTTGTTSQPPTVRGQLRDPQGRLRPLADAANVDVRSAIELTFSRSMDAASITSAFSLSPRVQGTFTIEQQNTRLIFAHQDPFPLGQAFVVMIRGDARDDSAERVPLGGNFVERFTTPQIGTFRVLSTQPAQQTPPAQAQADTAVQLVFGEPVDVTSARQNIVFAPAAANPVLSFTNGDQAVIINHANIAASTAVSVTVSRNLTSAVGVTLRQATGGRDFVLDYTIEAVPPKLADQNPTVPANDARNVSPSTNITFNFNERLDPSTVNTTTFTVTRGGNPITGTVALSPSGQSVVFTPATTLRADPSPVVATATTGIRDLGGTAIATNISISFFIDSTGPGLSFTDPADGATEVEVDRFATQPIVVDFTEAVDQAVTRRGFSIAPSGGTTRTGGGGVVTFGSATRLLYTTSSPLQGQGTQYTVRIAAQDLAGNPSAALLVFSFTTDATPPQVNTGTLQPAPGATNQSRQPIVSMEFTELMNTDTIRGAFSLTSAGQNFGAASGTFVFGETGTAPRRTTMTYTLNATVQLPADKEVRVNVTQVATDLGLTPLATRHVSTFTTGP